MRSESRWCVAAVIALGALQSLGAQAANANDEILVLGIFQNGKLKERLSSALIAHLRGSEAVLPADSLLPSERQCQRGPCLMRVAEKTGARFLVWGVVSEGNSRAQTSVMMHLFDSQQVSMDILPGSAPAETPLDEVINQLGVKLLQHYRTPSPNIPLSTQRNPLSDLDFPRQRTERPSQTWRVGVATGLGIVTALSLGASIVMSVLYNAPAEGACPYNGRDDRCAWKFTYPIVAGYTLSAVGAVGIGLTLGLR